MMAFLDLPIEIRILILDYVFLDARISFGTTVLSRYRFNTWQPRLEIVQVCPQLREEALSRYQLTLYIDCGTAMLDKWESQDKLNSLAPMLKAAVTHVVLEGQCTFDYCQFIEHFPNIKSTTWQCHEGLDGVLAQINRSIICHSPEHTVMDADFSLLRNEQQGDWLRWVAGTLFDNYLQSCNNGLREVKIRKYFRFEMGMPTSENGPKAVASRCAIEVIYYYDYDKILDCHLRTISGEQCLKVGSSCQICHEQIQAQSYKATAIEQTRARLRALSVGSKPR